MLRFHCYRLYPSQAQRCRLEATLEVCRALYNELLRQRIAAHRAGEELSRYEQIRQVTVYRRAHPEAAEVHSASLQAVAGHVERAWRAWRRGGGQGDGPRLRGDGDTRSFLFQRDGNGFKVVGRRLRLFHVGRVAVRWHKPLEGTLKTLHVSRRFGDWYATFGCEVEPAPLPPTGVEVGIDLGTVDLLVLSTGERVTCPRFELAAKEELAALWARANRAVPGSKGHGRAMDRLVKAQVKIAARRHEFMAKLANDLVARFDRLAVEQLNIGKMAGNRRAVADAGWGRFIRVLKQKAELAGRCVLEVRAAWSSQTCSSCRWQNRRYLPHDEKVFVCEKCGARLDRDLNAAREILERARETWSLGG